MDIKNLENEPYAVVISIHINNYLNFYGKEAKFYLEYALSLPDGLLEMMNPTTRDIDAAQAAIRLMLGLRTSYPSINLVHLLEELYSEAV